LQAHLQIIIAFRMLPEVVWAMPPMGTFNLHASLLPKYRGAAPINWAVMNGDTTTGVTTFFLKHEIDTGDVIEQRSIAIGRHDNVEVVYDRLMMLGADMVLETVDSILAGTVHSTPQEQMLTAGEQPTPAPKIFTETCRLDWTRPAEALYNHVRGLSPYPTAWTMVRVGNEEPRQLKVFVTDEPTPAPANAAPGTVLSDGKTMRVVCGDGNCLPLLEVQIAGKRRMTTPEFLRGTRGTLTIAEG
ncbi:MAG: methionyl-tRNA formyltransferase, partial [Muribaculaceae bacterium]|nr:methionyl-tRNA formyltransferase [Muribaculaceae bacterium]